jgi:hypothetical protein
VLLWVYLIAFFLSGAPPQQKDHASAAGVDVLDDRVGELLPTLAGVRLRLGTFYREHTVEQEHTLESPSL